MALEPQLRYLVENRLHFEVDELLDELLRPTHDVPDRSGAGILKKLISVEFFICCLKLAYKKDRS